MTIAPPRNKVPFALTTANELELLAGFMPAAVSVGWAKDAVMQTVDEAMSGDYGHLHAILSEWFLPAIAYRAS